MIENHDSFVRSLAVQTREKWRFSWPSAHVLSAAFALIPAVVGTVVLSGWSFGWESIERLGISSVTMNPTTATCLVCLSLALFAVITGSAEAKWFGPAAIALVIGVALLKILEIEFGSPLAVDRLLFRSALEHNGWHPSRMAPNTALCLLLIAGATALFARPQKWAVLTSQALAAFAGVIALFAMVGYAYSAPVLYGVGAFIPMAAHAAGSFLCLSLSLLFASRDSGAMTLISDKGPAGHSARVLLLPAFIIPFGLGWARLEGQRIGLYSSETGVAIMVTFTVLLLIGLIWRNSQLLLRVDSKRSEAEAALQRIATHDHLTALPNRALFMEHLSLRLASYRRRRSELFALCYADLDGFKQVNDQLGHEAGDDLLRFVANYLRSCLRAEDVVARFGGDEFTMLLRRVDSLEDARMLTSRIVAGMPRYWKTPRGHVHIGISLGVAIADNHPTSADILRDADYALYIAKSRGKGRVEISCGLQSQIPSVTTQNLDPHPVTDHFAADAPL